MNYADWITAVCNAIDIYALITDATAAPNGALTPTSNADFNSAIPRAIDYTENRIQRDLDLLATYTTDSSASTSANSRLFTLPTDKGTYLVITQINPIVSGVRQAPLVRLGRPALETLWPSDTAPTTPSVPTMFAEYDNASVLVAPAPDAAYVLEVVGTQRVTQLKANTSNFLTTSLPDLYLACSLVWWFGWQRDFGRQADDPQTAQSWENQYQLLLKSADVEEARKKWAGEGWTATQPYQVTTPRQT